jgi:hypothetical protein
LNLFILLTNTRSSKNEGAALHATGISSTQKQTQNK